MPVGDPPCPSWIDPGASNLGAKLVEERGDIDLAIASEAGVWALLAYLLRHRASVAPTAAAPGDPVLASRPTREPG